MVWAWRRPAPDELARQNCLCTSLLPSGDEYHIGIERALCQECRAANLFRFRLEHIDEERLGIADAFEGCRLSG
jgi:hypothetical protein